MVYLRDKDSLLKHVKEKYKEGKHRVPPTLRVEDEKELTLIYKTIFKVIQERIINNVAGVMLENIGYFHIWKCPKFHVTKFDNLETGGVFYIPDLYTKFVGCKYSEYWYFDRTVARDIKRGVHSKLKQGFRYKSYATDLVKLDKAKHSKKVEDNDDN